MSVNIGQNGNLVPIAGGGGSGHTIKDENDTSFTQRLNLKFIGATVTDDSINNTTNVTVGNDVGLSVVNGKICVTYTTT